MWPDVLSPYLGSIIDSDAMDVDYPIFLSWQLTANQNDFSMNLEQSR